MAPPPPREGLELSDILSACVFRTKSTRGWLGFDLFDALNRDASVGRDRLNRLHTELAEWHARQQKHVKAWHRKQQEQLKAWHLKQEEGRRKQWKRTQTEFKRFQNDVYSSIAATPVGSFLESLRPPRDEEPSSAAGQCEGAGQESAQEEAPRGPSPGGIGLGSYKVAFAVIVAQVYAYTRWASIPSTLPFYLLVFGLLILVPDLCGKRAAQRETTAKDLMNQKLAIALLPDGQVFRENTLKVYDCESSTGTVCLLFRPPGDAASWPADFKFARQFAGKKRWWELRLQLKFRRKPEDLYFGIEIDNYEPMSSSTKLIYGMVKRLMYTYFGAGLYHTAGEEPGKTQGEAEPPTLALPLWCFDQVIVTPAGQDPPDMTGVFDGLGVIRSKLGFRRYKEALAKIEAEMNTSDTYTFCFWGPSQSFHLSHWEVVGLPGGAKMDIADISGNVPMTCCIYDLGLRPRTAEGGRSKDKRHLRSSKHYYFKSALWHEAFCLPPAHLMPNN